MHEEVNLDVQVTAYVGRIHHAYTHFRVAIDAFRCRRRGGELALNGPVAHRWIALEEAADYAFPRASHKVFPLLSDEESAD